MTRVDAAALARAYRDEGWPLDRCAAEFGISRPRATSLLRDAGVTIRPAVPPPRPVDVTALVRAYAQEGRTLAQCAAEFGIAHRRASSVLRAQGVPVRLPGPRRARADPAAITSPGIARHLLRTDPPDHTRLQRLVSRAFTPRRVEALRPRIQQIADDFLAVFLPRGHADLVTDFAQPVPTTVIAELLVIPAADREEFARLTNIYGGVDESDAARVPGALAAIRGYLSALIEDKERGAHADAESGDLLDGLIAARDESGWLDHHELLAMAFVLLAAGYETTVRLIGNGALPLLRNPGQMAAPRADPQLIGPAIEEFLRTTARSR